MKSKPTQGKRHRKSKVKRVTQQGPIAPNAPPDPSPVQHENEFAEARRQARWLYEHGDEYRTKLLQNGTAFRVSTRTAGRSKRPGLDAQGRKAHRHNAGQGGRKETATIRERGNCPAETEGDSIPESGFAPVAGSGDKTVRKGV